MTAQHRYSILTLLAAATGTLLSSCTYDSCYYGGSNSLICSSVSGSSSSIFIKTGSSRWGYDPYRRCYYDYSRSCYYDPYLLGYYPRGYRPPVITGAPHPHGWHRGRSICPPPRNVRNHFINNHRNRYQQYCNLNHSWARSLSRHHHTPSQQNSISNHSNSHSNHAGHTSNQADARRADKNPHSNRSRQTTRFDRDGSSNLSAASPKITGSKHPLLSANAKAAAMRQQAQAAAAGRAEQTRQAQARQQAQNRQQDQARQAQAAALRNATQEKQAQSAAQRRAQPVTERKPVKGRIIR